jgi:hypothetical protein
MGIVEILVIFGILEGKILIFFLHGQSEDQEN